MSEDHKHWVIRIDLRTQDETEAKNLMMEVSDLILDRGAISMKDEIAELINALRYYSRKKL